MKHFKLLKDELRAQLHAHLPICEPEIILQRGACIPETSHHRLIVCLWYSKCPALHLHLHITTLPKRGCSVAYMYAMFCITKLYHPHYPAYTYFYFIPFFLVQCPGVVPPRDEIQLHTDASPSGRVRSPNFSPFLPDCRTTFSRIFHIFLCYF